MSETAADGLRRLRRAIEEDGAQRGRILVKLEECVGLLGVLEERVATLTQERDTARGLASATAGVLAERSAEVTELRAILAPLLDKPWQHARAGIWCVWCGRYQTTPEADGSEHWGDCPTYRRDGLLGREATT